MLSIRKEQCEQLAALIQAAGKVAVVGHTHADGDSLGASAAMALYLQQCCGKDVACVYSDTPADNLRFLLAPEVPWFFQDQDPEAALGRIAQAGLIVLLDCNAFSRTEGLQDALAASPARKVLIDHHLNPDTASFDLVISTPDISSASELLYWVLKSVAGTSPSGISVAIGTSLMAGMTTDTNNFANSVYPSTLQMASELLALGVDRDALLDRIYRSYRENRVRLMGYMQGEGLRLVDGGGAYMIITRDIQRRFDMQEGESEGLVNVPLTIGSIRLSVLLREEGDVFRVSVRSKKGTSAQQLAQRHFHGGGHENAAGGKLTVGVDIASPEQAPAYVEQLLKTYLA